MSLLSIGRYNCEWTKGISEGFIKMEIAVDRLGGDTRIPRPFYSIKISRLRRKAALCAAPLSTVSTNDPLTFSSSWSRAEHALKNILHLLPLRNSARFRKLARSKTICPREEGRGVNLFIINDGILNEYTSEKRGGRKFEKHSGNFI